jgi:hypothetical protein
MTVENGAMLPLEQMGQEDPVSADIGPPHDRRLCRLIHPGELQRPVVQLQPSYWRTWLQMGFAVPYMSSCCRIELIVVFVRSCVAHLVECDFFMLVEMMICLYIYECT